MSTSTSYKNRHQVKLKPESKSSAWESWIKPTLILTGVIGFFALLFLVQIGKIKGPIAVAVAVIYIGLIITDCIVEFCGGYGDSNDKDDDEN